MGTNLNGGVGVVYVTMSPRENHAGQGYSSNDQTHLIGCNQPLTYKVGWGSTLSRIGNLSLDSDLIAGDLVNVLFDVYIGVDYADQNVVTSGSTANAGRKMVLAGTLRKSRDIPYVRNIGINPEWNEGNLQVDSHQFTVDVAPLVKSYLSYTLTPIKKGAMSSEYQMGGQYYTDDKYPFTSIQGSLRYVDVQMRFEVKESAASSKLVIASNGSTIVRKNTGAYAVINSVPQFYGDGAEYGNLNLWRITGEEYVEPRGKFFSLCPNSKDSYLESKTTPYDSPKLVRMDEEAEWLSYYLESFTRVGNTLTAVDFYMRITAYNYNGSSNYINCRDWKDTVLWPGATFGTFPFNTPYVGLNKYVMQNVSPTYLNTLGYWTGSGITDDTDYYTAVLYSNDGSSFRVSDTRYFTIDRESKNNAFPFVRFHWVNRMGGIDSYTAKRDTTEGVDVTKTFFEKKSPLMQYIQQYNGIVFTNEQDPLGADTYKPSIETLGITATTKGSVFTDPLNTPQAKWLEEIVTSPNVWIELENTASKRAKTDEPTSHPSKKDYFPVIINNSTVSTVDESLGLVKFNIEYTYSHKINTQSN